MLQPVRILHIEDDEDDAALIRRELEHSGCELGFYLRVETLKDLQEGLREKEWDLILCDYKLSGFNGMDALKVFKEFNQDIPFILISGAIGEEPAVAAMKAGAHDYLMKDNLARLVPAIERELHDAKIRRERKRAEALLQQSQADLAEAQKAAKVGNWRLNIATNQITMSNELYRIFDIEKTKFDGKYESFLKCVYPDDRERVVGSNLTTSESGQPFDIEYRITSRMGKLKHIRGIGYATKNVAGKVSGLFGTAQDITERKQAELKARHLSSFPELNPTPIIEISKQDAIIYSNPAAISTLSKIGVADLRAFLPDDFADILKMADDKQVQYRKIVEIGERKFGETIYYTPEFQSFRLYARDITESLKTEKALSESEQRYRMLVDNQEEGIALLDDKANFLFANPAAERIFGSQPGGLTGHNLSEFLTTNQNVMVNTDIDRQLQGGKTCYEWEITRTDSQKLNLLVTATAQFTPDKAMRAIFCIFRDITERKQAELALQKLNVELEQRVDERTAELSAANAALARASRLKDEFLANMSHELRTPLTAVLNLSEALQEQTYGPLNEKQLKSLHTIEESGRHLLGLINDILDLSKVEAGYVRLELADCSAVEICQSSLQLVKGMAQKKHQVISFMSSPENFHLKADARRLKQMLVNLLSNAIKFTPDGGSISLSVKADEIANVVQFIVRDNGIGIDPKDLPKLFLPFTQLDSGLSRQQAGTGLGLALVQRMADLHGGSVSVDSTPAGGSCFTIILPWMSPSPDYAPPLKRTTGFLRHQTQPLISRSTASEGPPLILLADDNETNINTYSDYLLARGFQVSVAHNGEEAIRKAEILYPDLILMDIQMPGVNGLEATQRIRRHTDRQIAEIPVIALTALAMPGDREQCLDAGANEYLSKPVSLSVLVQAIEVQLSRATHKQTNGIKGQGN